MNVGNRELRMVAGIVIVLVFGAVALVTEVPGWFDGSSHNPLLPSVTHSLTVTDGDGARNETVGEVACTRNEDGSWGVMTWADESIPAKLEVSRWDDDRVDVRVELRDGGTFIGASPDAPGQDGVRFDRLDGWWTWEDAESGDVLRRSAGTLTAELACDRVVDPVG